MAITLSGAAQVSYLPIDNIPVGKFDTVMVVFLVSDTTHQIKTLYKALDCDSIGCKLPWETHSHLLKVEEDLGVISRQSSFSIFGYVVNLRKKWADSPGSVCWNCPNYWEIVCYLDTSKRLLNKNYIVWETKRIKP